MHSPFARSLSILCLAAASVAAVALPSYSLKTLATIGTGSTDDSYGLGLNNSGSVVGWSNRTAFVYSNGTVKTLQHGAVSTASGINDSGQICGTWTNDVFGPGNGFTYSNGTFKDLPHLSSGTPLNPTSINASGQVVGTTDGHGFLYSNNTMKDIGSLGPGNSQYWVDANDINDAGHITGRSNLATGQSSHAMLYRNNAMEDLGTLGGAYSNGFAINNSDQVTGSSDLSSSGSHAFLYSAGSMTDLGALAAGGSSKGYGINSLGQVVGQADTMFGNHAFVYTGGKMLDLNSLVDSSATGWIIMDARGINDSGLIVGAAINPQLGSYRAVLLTPNPVPEPASILAFAGGALLLRRRRQK